MFDKSVASETMYSPFTPDKKFEQDKLVKKSDKHKIIDFKDVMG